jgi:hypothetical protein
VSGQTTVSDRNRTEMSTRIPGKRGTIWRSQKWLMRVRQPLLARPALPLRRRRVSCRWIPQATKQPMIPSHVNGLNGPCASSSTSCVPVPSTRGDCSFSSVLSFPSGELSRFQSRSFVGFSQTFRSEVRNHALVLSTPALSYSHTAPVPIWRGVRASRTWSFCAVRKDREQQGVCCALSQ